MIPDRAGYALVTGGGARIGAALSRRLAADGWAVAIHYHNSADAAEALATEIKTGGGRAVTLGCDLADPAAFADLFARANAGWGFCSLLVNNASAFEYDDIANVTRENLDRLFAVNLHAPVLLAREFAEQLRGEAKGLIVNLLDQKVFNLNPDFLSYTLTKAALEAATRLLAQAMAPRVRVCGLAPGLTLKSGEQTEEGFQAAHEAAPLGFGSEPADIAEALSFLVKVPSITGTTIVVDGGQHLQKRSRDVMFTYGIAGDAPVGKA
ncbi:MAG: SDR family oxidoreductase [Proteobacteria bacterium]|nr:SDR family oxidoreductase [Pseudomonadota bacterium]